MELSRLHRMAAKRFTLGFTLIEALIAMFVFSIALLGIAAMYSRALGVSHSAYLRSLASIQAMDLAERIRANPEITAIDEDAYELNCETGFYGGEDCNSGACEPDELAKWDKEEWCSNTASLFGGLFGNAIVTFDEPDYEIQITWQERALEADNKQSIEEVAFNWRVRQ